VQSPLAGIRQKCKINEVVATKKGKRKQTRSTEQGSETRHQLPMDVRQMPTKEIGNK
jgi:hypothetical protein